MEGMLDEVYYVLISIGLAHLGRFLFSLFGLSRLTAFNGVGDWMITWMSTERNEEVFV